MLLECLLVSRIKMPRRKKITERVNCIAIALIVLIVTSELLVRAVYTH